MDSWNWTCSYTGRLLSFFYSDSNLHHIYNNAHIFLYAFTHLYTDTHAHNVDTIHKHLNIYVSLVYAQLCLILCNPSRLLCPWDSPGKNTAAAARSFQLCPTLCDPIDGSPPGSPVPGILQARTLEWGAISSSNGWKWKVKVKLLSRVWLFSNPMDCSPPGSSVHGIFYARVLEWGAIVLQWVAISFSRDLPISGIKPVSPAWQVDSLPLGHQGSLHICIHTHIRIPC